MAIANTTQVAGLIDRVWQPTFVDLLSRDDFLMKRLPKAKGYGDGIRWKVIADAKNTSAGSYAEGAGLPVAVGHAFLDAFLTWRYEWVGIEVTGQAQAQAAGPGGFSGFNDVLESEISQSVMDLKNTINTHLLATTLGAATDIDGIGIGILDSGIYANINAATYPEWAAYRAGNAGVARPLTIALMQTVKTAVEDQPRGGNVTVITAPPTQFNAYGNLLTAQRRFTSSETLDGGFQSLEFEGTPVVKVANHPAGRMYFLSEKGRGGEANLQYVTLQNFKTLDKSQGRADSMYMLVTHYAQLQIRNRRTQGVLTDLA
ncbi:MAG TPA: phage major capsid protein [Chloroflexota bacterium]|nr:phage major capsid protein [Chloroflexota bacterium]